MYEQAVLPIQDEKTFAEVHGALESAFSAAKVEGFLRGIQRAHLRARQFEAILAGGLLGSGTAAKYAALGDSDRGHIREQYLKSIEQVAPAVRAKFMRVYTAY
ncbi:hypothetical protein [Silvibacterium dinghuense]|uniref:Uncharacterized protein n=1 Tax=Silvibacterium dinghuense TaxID=1560006 RepID=A0A4Q1SK49_9BACT|nr:hypothetical protein [Silvibacterium dinghuense]RXS98046.1 hypothetical protein ESZ00_09490 [Silvibacterium dinghuense]GGH04078.1 hypothetical protein GCM10011586_20130 [Silvibacterium dinghuense]